MDIECVILSVRPYDESVAGEVATALGLSTISQMGGYKQSNDGRYILRGYTEDCYEPAWYGWPGKDDSDQVLAKHKMQAIQYFSDALDTEDDDKIMFTNASSNDDKQILLDLAICLNVINQISDSNDRAQMFAHLWSQTIL